MILMLHLIASIALTQDYGSPPIDDANLSDLDNAVVSSLTILSQDSSELSVERAAGGPHGTCYIDLPVGATIDDSYGAVITAKYDIDIAFNDVTHKTSVALYSGSTQIAGSSQVTLDSGAQSIQLSVDRGSASFDKVRIYFLYSGADPNASFSLTNVELLSQGFGDFDTDDRILVYWDDDADAIYVEREDNPGATLTEITDGPNLGQLVVSQISGVDFDHNRSEYQFCNSTDLVRFPFSLNSPDFPYVTIETVPDVPECAVTPVVCDIHFTEQPEITDATPFAADGSVQLAATSTQGDVRYTDDDSLFYSEISDETGLFENLPAGTYTFYALDEVNCKISVSVIIGTTTATEYDTKYLLQYYDKQTQVQSTIEIEERNFNGVSSEIKGDGTPFSIVKNSGEINNKFDVLRPTSATFKVVSERHFQFLGLFSQDDLKYRIKYGHGSSSWLGFLTASVYSEQYSPSSKYIVTLTASDNLNLLKDIDLLDDSGNRLSGNKTILNIVATCLRRTSLGVNILSCFNNFASGMSAGATEDPLAQTFIDCATFYDEEDGTAMKCGDVIEMLLKPLGCFVEQVNSKWRIVDSDAQTEPYAYREYTKNAVYVTNGTIDPQLEIAAPTTNFEDVIFADNGHSLDIIPAYGKVDVILNLKPKASVFPLSMEERRRDAASGWTTNLVAAGGIFSQAFQVPGKQYKGIRFKGFYANNGAGLYARLFSPEFTTKSANDAVEIKFNYKATYPDIDARAFGRSHPPLWVRIRWQLKLTIGSDVFYFSESAGWNQDAAYTENKLYVNQFLGEDASFSRSIDLPAITPASAIKLQTIFRFEGVGYLDFANLAALKAIATVDLPVGSKIRGIITNSDWAFVTGSTQKFWYVLDQSTDAESNHATEIPSVVRPTDYNGSTNPVVWRIEPGSWPSIIPIDAFALSEFRLRFLPNRIDPLETDTTSEVNNENFKESLEYEISAGDVPTDIIQPEIYSNIFKLSNGTPTFDWVRNGNSENIPIQQMLLSSLINQYRKPTWRLRGNWMAPEILPTSILKHTVPAVTISLVNEEDPNAAGWVQSGSGQAWVGSSGYTAVTFDAVDVGDSVYLTQPAENLFAGSRIRIEFGLERLDSSGSRIDRLVCVLLNDGDVVQRVTLYDGLQDNIDLDEAVSFNIDSDADEIGFFIENISGAGDECEYRMDHFRGNGVAAVRYYYLNAYSRMDRDNKYQLEAVQLLPVVASTEDDIDDTGGGGTG